MTQSSTEPVRILLVADDAGDARLVVGNLRAAPSLAATVVRVTPRDVAAGALERGGIDLILLDVSLSEAGAVDTVRRVLAAAPELPIVVLTTVVDEDLAMQSIRHAGAEDYLVKEQMSPTLLARSIHHAIERKRLEVEGRRLLATSAEINGRLIVTTLGEQNARKVAEAAVRACHVLSHDIGNLVAAIQIYVDKLLGDVPEDTRGQRQHRFASGIGQLAAEIQELRKRILDTAVIEAGGLSISPELQQPRDLLISACQTLMPIAQQKDVVLSVALEPELPAVRADRARILQALGNVMGNAIKFPPRGGTISVRADTLGKEVRVTVADTGAGIAPEEIPLVFEPFWKTQGTNAHGAGLGLGIARGIMELHGGRIDLESQIGRGTIVTLRLPIAEADGLPKPSSTSAAAVRAEPRWPAMPASWRRGRGNRSRGSSR